MTSLEHIDAVIRKLLSSHEQDVVECMANGMRETPSRVVNALYEMTSGYKDDPAEILAKQFEVADTLSQMVTLKGVEFASLCEHHLLPFTGTAALAYIPTKGSRVVGLSKLARLVQCYAKRFQMQERMTHQIRSAVDEHLDVEGAMVVVKAHHSCMGCRGIEQRNAEMVTSSVSGVFQLDQSARAEALALFNL